MAERQIDASQLAELRKKGLVVEGDYPSDRVHVYEGSSASANNLSVTSVRVTEDEYGRAVDLTAYMEQTSA